MVTDRSNKTWTHDAEHPAARFAADCALQLDICGSLLAVADRLPHALDVQALNILSKLVPATWDSHLALQGEAILPLITRRHENMETFLSRFEPFAKQHIEISGVNDELVECFVSVSRGEPLERGMLGYLIRNAAERRKEHVDWERVLLAPLLPQTLTPEERRRYQDWASANPWPYAEFKKLSITDLH